jgi:hypothetical protein
MLHYLYDQSLWQWNYLFLFIVVLNRHLVTPFCCESRSLAAEDLHVQAPWIKIISLELGMQSMRTAY